MYVPWHVNQDDKGTIIRGMAHQVVCQAGTILNFFLRDLQVLPKYIMCSCNFYDSFYYFFWNNKFWHGDWNLKNAKIGLCQKLLLLLKDHLILFWHVFCVPSAWPKHMV